MNLPTVLSEDVWFYKKYKKECEPLLGKPYISNSSISSWQDYREDFFKSKFARLKIPPGIYADFGSYVGTSVENGRFPDENPYGFVGQENLDLSKYDREWEYEKFVFIDMGSYVVIGFADYVKPLKDGISIVDVKTVSNSGRSKYKKKEYIQTVLYGYALELQGKKVLYTGVELIERSGSHVNGPIGIGAGHEHVELPFNKKRVDYALKVVDKTAKEISEYYTTYQKIFE